MRHESASVFVLISFIALFSGLTCGCNDPNARRGGPTGRVARIGGMDFIELGGGECVIGLPSSKQQSAGLQAILKALGIEPTGGDYQAPYSVPRRVVVEHSFFISTTEVTLASMRLLCGDNEIGGKEDGQAPMTHAKLEQVAEYCRKMTLLAGRLVCRLPSEWEWEFACRAGSQTIYSFGDDPALLEAHAWTRKDSCNRSAGPSAQFVARKKPNAWGLYDCHGNVWEVCFTSDPDYDGAGSWIDPVADVRRANLVCRGGSFLYSEAGCTSFARRPFVRCYPEECGFRVVLVQPSQTPR